MGKAASAGKWLWENTEVIVFGLSIFLFEAWIVTIYAVWAGYTVSDTRADEEIVLYPYFRDVNIMIFFGFGFLMAYLRRYGYSAICYSMMIAALSAQQSVIFQWFFEELDEDAEFDIRRDLGITELLNGLFCAGAVLISYGAILGKTTPLQLVILCFVEPFFYWLNIFICILKLEAFDVGGGFVIHIFGAFFGLGMTVWLTSKKTKGHQDSCSCYTADLFSLPGTLFLWLMWPSFNAALVTGVEQLRALVNTFLSLTGAIIGTFLASRWFSEGMFEVCHMQNSTLAGGVVMGVAAHLNIYPASAVVCGFVSAIISVLGYRFLTPFLSQYLGIQDVCGINNLHGMPGILGGLLSIFAAAGLAQDTPEEFPQGHEQAGYQTAALFITIGIGLGAGLVTGLVLRLVGFLRDIPPPDYFNDRTFWQLPSDYEWVIESEEVELEDVSGSRIKRKKTFLRTMSDQSLDDQKPPKETPEDGEKQKKPKKKKYFGTKPKKKMVTRTGSRLDLGKRQEDHVSMESSSEKSDSD